MNLDFQIDAATLESAVSARVAREVNSGTRWIRGVVEMPLSLADPTPVPVVVHRIDVVGVHLQNGMSRSEIGGARYGQSTTVNITHTDATGPVTTALGMRPVLAVATLILRMARVSTLLTRNHSPLPESRLVPIYVRVVLQASLAASASGARLHLAFLGLGFSASDRGYIDASLLPVPESVVTEIQNMVATLPEVPIDAASLLALLPPEAGIPNVGLCLSDGAVTIRLQLEPWLPSQESAMAWIDDWRRFFRSTPNRLDGQHWALLVPGNLFGAIVRYKVMTGLEGHERVEYDSAHWEWSSADGGKLTTWIRVNVLGLCVPWNIDVHATVSVISTFALVDTNTLRTQLAIGYGPEASELALCALGNAGLAAILLGAIFGEAGGEEAGIVGVIVGFIAGLLATILVGDLYEADLGLDDEPGLTPVEGTTNQFYSDATLPTNTANELGHVTVSGISATSDSLSINGTIAILPYQRPELALREPEGFQWDFLVPCVPDNLGVAARFHGYNAGAGTLVVTHVDVLAPTPIQYQGANTELSFPARTDVFAHDAGFTITEWLTLAALATMQTLVGTAYGQFRLLLQTTGGARIVTITGVGPTLTAEARERALRFHDFACTRRRASGPFPPDRRRPPLPGAVTWVVRGAGFRAGSGIRVTGARQFAMHADARGNVGARWWELSHQTTEQIEIELVPSPDGPAAHAQVAVARGDYVRTAHIPLAGTYRSHALAWLGGRIVLQLVTSRGIELFDLADPYRPVRIDTLRRSGVRGALIHDNAHVVWGDDGLSAGARLGELRPRLATPILDAIMHRGQVVVLHEHTVTRLDRSSTARESLAHDGGIRLHRGASGILVETPVMVAKCDFTERALHPVEAAPTAGTARWSGTLAALLGEAEKSICVHALVGWHSS